MGLRISYCLKLKICRIWILSDRDIKKIMYRELESGYLQYIRMKACRLLSINNKFYRNSTVPLKLAMAVLSNESSYKQLDCDKGLVMSNNSTYILL